MSSPACNLELKVRCDPVTLQGLRTRVESSTCQPIVRLRQVDTYFMVDRGRLKLRELRNPADPAIVERAELIACDRPDESGSRWSDYVVVPVPSGEVDRLLVALALTHEVRCRVEKAREVAIVGQTRVHLDEVVGLGCFIELETVVRSEPDAGAETEHAQVIDLLKLDRSAAIPGSYSDLVLDQQR
jgi:adenylate cyclase class IV